MKKRLWIGMTLTLILTLCAACAFAADVFQFASRSVDVFEGGMTQVALNRDGAAVGEGPVTYTSANEKIATVAEDGTITAVKKGQTTIRAAWKGEKRSWNASVTVNVIRAVTDVTLNTTRMQVYRPTDPAISELLRDETEHDVIVIAAGRSMELKATCTPSDANNRRVIFTSSDEGILKAGSESARALQAGECDLTISSMQNPEIFEVYHVMVTQPVTKVTVSSPAGKTLGVGESFYLGTVVEPANATISSVTWSSRNPQVATVDVRGVVTGVKRGSVTIEAKAADGSGKTGAISLTVAQPVTSIAITEASLSLANNQQAYVHATAYPTDANDKGITWSSSDPTIATVAANGQVKGLRRGECQIIATSRSNPNVSASITVQVIQRVTSVTFPDGPVSLPIRTTKQLVWQVLPADATIQDVTFSSNNNKVATVDQNGVVTGLTRGSATITATAIDGSNKRGQVRVTVTQPVEGVSMQYGVYHIQQGRNLNVKAIISPSNANNQNMHFTIGDEYIATVTDQKNIGRVRGWHDGTTTITGVTEDGGYSASAEIRVADFNRAIVVDDLYLESDKIRIVLRNRSDFTVDRVYFTVETYDVNGEPLVCNSDGASNTFDGSYRLLIEPGEKSEHYQFNFGNYVQPTETIGIVNLTVTGWRDLEGYTRNIPEAERPSQSYRRFIPTGAVGAP